MISANFLINQLAKHGFNFFSGVPCSYLTSVINGVINSKKIKYIGATSEGEAVGIASGAWLAGKKGVTKFGSWQYNKSSNIIKLSF